MSYVLKVVMGVVRVLTAVVKLGIIIVKATPWQAISSLTLVARASPYRNVILWNILPGRLSQLHIMSLTSLSRWYCCETHTSKLNHRDGFSQKMGLIPDEAKGLPPPGIMNYNSAWMALMGWCVVMIDNAVKLRPPIRSG